MSRPLIRRLIACGMALGLIGASPGVVHATGAATRIQGVLLDLDGRPAAQRAVRLLDTHTGNVTDVVTDAGGNWSAESLPEGDYLLAAELADGSLAPVAGPPARVRSGTPVVRDVKLIQGGPMAPPAAFAGNASLASWWKDLTTPAKFWVVFGVVLGGAITAAAFDSGPAETPASPM